MIDNTTVPMDDEVERLVSHYRNMRSESPKMYEECMWQYANMAHGGPGSSITNIKDSHYKNYPTSFFMRVLSCLGEFDLYLQASTARSNKDLD